MGYHVRESIVRQRASANGTESSRPMRLVASEGADTNATCDGHRERSVAASSGNVRLDVWGGGGGVELTTLRHIDLIASGVLDVRIGTVAAEKFVLTPGSGGKAYLAVDLALTRSAAAGIWVNNPSTTSAVTIEFMFS